MGFVLPGEMTQPRAIACEIVKKHNETLKEDPELLSTGFMQKLIGIDCDKV
jgi:hypothetical protein